MENILSEYDKSPGIISPNFEKMDLHLPKRAVFAFLGEKRIERFAFARGGEKVGTFVSLTKDFPLWMIKADKEELCVLQAPAGASAAVLLLERLYAYGVEKVVALGCCGALEKLAENVFFVVRKALRDEGTSYHYLPPARFVTLDESAANIVEGVLRENHVSCESCVAWSTDGFFRETKEKVKARRAAASWIWNAPPWRHVRHTGGRYLPRSFLLLIHFTIYLTNSGRGEKKAAIRRSSWESKRRRGYEGRVMSAGELLFGGLLAVNAAAFFLYGLDKWKAVHGRRRIRERTLLFIAAAGGSAGAFLAMRFFRHKTRHAVFQFGVPVLFLLQAAFAFFLWK